MPASLHFLAHKVKSPLSLSLIEEPRLDGGAARRKLVNDREVEVAVERQGESARNRRRGHHQDVRRDSLADQPVALHHSETVLLVHDDQAQPGELHVLFDQGVRADYKMDAPLGNPPFEFRLLGGLTAAD